MSEPLPDWDRPYYTPGGGDPFLFYVVFGEVDSNASLDTQAYRCAGIPDGLDLMAYDRDSHPDVFAGFQDGFLWERLRADDPALAAEVSAASRCVMLRGTVADPPDLNYLRDTVGLLTYCLDRGGRVLYDPQMFFWWPPGLWREKAFNPAQPVPRRHAVILVSDEDGESGGRQWYHTRGMRKFGRPDLSVRGVPPPYREGVIDLCTRFIEYQALGAVIPDGQEIRMASLPAGGVARHGGDVEDPDFNNVHVEISWPGGL
jgi:hypothetical protein